MTMRTHIFLLILAISGMVFLFTPSPATAQDNGISGVLQEKENQGSGMKSRSFRKPEPAAPPANKPPAEATDKSATGTEYSEIVEDAGAVPEDEKRPPEEDVWEKYKSISAGSESKTLTRKTYAVGKEETTHTKKFKKTKGAEESEEDSGDTETEESDDSEEKDEEKEAEAPKKKKGGMAGILEDYKNKQTNKKPIRGHTLNQ